MLYVDGDQGMRFAAALVLRKTGTNVETASSGKDALTRLISGDLPPAVLITDWTLPDMDGLQFIQKSRGAGFAGRIVIISDPVAPAQRVIMKAVGVDAVITKPCGPDELKSAVARFFPTMAPA